MESAVRAVVLLSGGLDSATALAVARHEGRWCYPLTIAYGQRHACEVDAAMAVADAMGEDTHVVNVPALGELAHSALTTDGVEVPRDRSHAEMAGGVPATYVPARNTVLLGLALACAESIGAREIWTGFNVLDAGGYPDCRPQFVSAFEALANVATAPGLPWSIRTPLIALTKSEIIQWGMKLGVDYSITHSCYDPAAGVSTGKKRWLACGRCDACQLRRDGFRDACVADPTRYA
jgi:7-cyano-7-deazaguanine synthase